MPSLTAVSFFIAIGAATVGADSVGTDKPDSVVVIKATEIQSSLSPWDPNFEMAGDQLDIRLGRVVLPGDLSPFRCPTASGNVDAWLCCRQVPWPWAPLPPPVFAFVERTCRLEIGVHFTPSGVTRIFQVEDVPPGVYGLWIDRGPGLDREFRLRLTANGALGGEVELVPWFENWVHLSGS